MRDGDCSVRKTSEGIVEPPESKENKKNGEGEREG